MVCLVRNMKAMGKVLRGSLGEQFEKHGRLTMREPRLQNSSNIHSWISPMEELAESCHVASCFSCAIEHIFLNASVLTMLGCFTMFVTAYSTGWLPLHCTFLGFSTIYPAPKFCYSRYISSTVSDEVPHSLNTICLPIHLKKSKNRTGM